MAYYSLGDLWVDYDSDGSYCKSRDKYKQQYGNSPCIPRQPGQDYKTWNELSKIPGQYEFTYINGNTRATLADALSETRTVAKAAVKDAQIAALATIQSAWNKYPSDERYSIFSNQIVDIANKANAQITNVTTAAMIQSAASSAVGQINNVAKQAADLHSAAREAAELAAKQAALKLWAKDYVLKQLQIYGTRMDLTTKGGYNLLINIAIGEKKTTEEINAIKAAVTAIVNGDVSFEVPSLTPNDIAAGATVKDPLITVKKEGQVVAQLKPNGDGTYTDTNGNTVGLHADPDGQYIVNLDTGTGVNIKTGATKQFTNNLLDKITPPGRKNVNLFPDVNQMGMGTPLIIGTVALFVGFAIYGKLKGKSGKKGRK